MDLLCCLSLLHSDDCETGRSFTQRIWSHATEQTWYQSPYSGVINKRFYVASAIWDVCPSGGANSKWGLARIAVIAHECAHFLGLPDLYNADGNGGAGGFDMAGNMWGWTGSQVSLKTLEHAIGWLNAILTLFIAAVPAAYVRLEQDEDAVGKRGAHYGTWYL